MRSLPLVTIGLAQGAYGDHGNLELVVPDPVSGFRVHWMNGDDAAVGAVGPRGWSAGLHVETGGRVDGVRIAQVASGPRFLEATLLQDGVALRWTWRPDRGFVPGGSIAPSRCAPSAIVEHDGAMHVLTADEAGVVHHVAETGRYPTLTWTASRIATGAATALDLAVTQGGLIALVVADGRATRHDLATGGAALLPGSWVDATMVRRPLATVGLDGSGTLHGVPGLAADGLQAVSAVRSTLDGGTLEVVALRDGAVLHARVGEEPAAFRPIAS